MYKGRGRRLRDGPDRPASGARNRDGAMKIQVLYFEGCPNHLSTVDLARQVVAELGLDAEVEEVEVTSGDDAAGLRFHGSPTVLIDGADIEPTARDRSDFGFSCRTYAGAGVPPRQLMVAAIESAVPKASGGDEPAGCQTSEGCAQAATAVAAEPPISNGRAGLWAAGGSLGSAVLASACCWVPLALLAFGASAAGISAAFEKTRPLFLGVAAVLLGTGFYLNYFRIRTAACSPCAVPRPKLRRFNRAMLWVSTVVVLAVALFPHYVSSLIAMGSPAVAAQAASGAPTTTLRIGGMTCEGCAAVVHSALMKVPGVRGASVSYPQGRALITLDPDTQPSNESLIVAVEKMGFQASIAASSSPSSETAVSTEEK